MPNRVRRAGVDPVQIEGGGASIGSVTVSSSALPAGASTAANQAAEIILLADIDTNTDAIEGTLSSILTELGQKTEPADTQATSVPVGATGATVTVITPSTSNQTMLASNTARRDFLAYNDSNKDAYIRFGTPASTTTFTLKLAPGTLYERQLNYSGIVTVIWASTAGGSLYATEVTA